MSLLRAFIAIEIPPEIHKEIEHSISPLRSALGPERVRWVATDNIHITLKFLGQTSPNNLDMLEQMLGLETSQYQPFEIQVGGLGVFPNPRRPTVIWIGIQAPADLETLQHGIETAAAKIGYPNEKRPFSPHLTIGRIRQNLPAKERHKVRKTLEQTQIGALGCLTVHAIHLFKSDLKPSGAVYTCLFSAQLKEGDSPDSGGI